MNIMNQILGALTSNLQTALNNTGYLTYGQADRIVNIVVDIWSDDRKYIVQNSSVWA